MVASLVVSTGAGLQWMDRVDSAEEAGHGGEEAIGLLQTFGRSVPRAAEGAEAEPFIEPVISTWVWWQNSGLEFGIGSLADGLAILLLWLVAFISLLVQIFSLDYVRDDRRYTHFFGALTLFSAGMLIMVMAPNMVQLILGWEIMGLTSFMLIGHWWEDYPNSRAALKAFFTVRVGDVGLLVGHDRHLLLVERLDCGEPARQVGLRHRRDPGVGALGRFVCEWCGHPRRRGRVVHRLHRQVRPVPVAHLASRCHGGSDAGLVAAPLVDDGRGRRLPRCPDLPGLLGRLQHRQRWTQLHRRHRSHHHRHRRTARVRAGRHQEGARLLDGVASSGT